MRVIVAIPAYCCEKQLPRVLEGLQRKPELRQRIEKVVIIDNQSSDHTVSAAQSAIEKMGLSELVEVYRNRHNYGLGGTHKVAFQMAQSQAFDYCAILHGDNQATTEELGDLIDLANRHPEASAILGSRFSRGSRLRGYSVLRSCGNKALNFIYAVLTWRKTEDLGSGLNLFKVTDLELREINQFSDSFTFNMDLLLYFIRNKRRLIFAPITWSETDQVSNAKTFRVGWIALKTIVKWRFDGKPNLKAPEPRSYLADRVTPT